DEARETIELWSARDWPLVLRRPDDDERPTSDVTLGLPLPPAQRKRRLKIRLPVSQIARVAPPLLLDDVVAALPREWSRAVAMLAQAARAQDLEVRVFGSAAWHAITGLAYLR